MHSAPARKVIAVVVLASWSWTAMPAAQRRDPRTIPGEWRPFARQEPMPRPGEAPWVTPQMIDAMRAQLAAVADLFRRTPVLGAPVGFVVFPHRSIQFQRSFTEPRTTDQRWALPAHLQLAASHFEDDGKVFDTGSEFSLNLEVNNLGIVFNNSSPWARDGESTMYLEPPAPGKETHGHAVYPAGVLITHRTAPPYVPVSVERVLQVKQTQIDAFVAQARQYVQQLASSPASDFVNDLRRAAAGQVAMGESRAKEIRDQLAALDTNARRAPAHAAVGADLSQPLVGRNAEGARMVVQPNPDFFDASRPGDIQALVIAAPCDDGRCDWRSPFVEQAMNQLDWQALGALVK